MSKKKIDYGTPVFATMFPKNFGRAVRGMRSDGQFIVSRRAQIGPKPKHYSRPLHLSGCTCPFCYSFPRSRAIEIIAGAKDSDAAAIRALKERNK